MSSTLASPLTQKQKLVWSLISRGLSAAAIVLGAWLGFAVFDLFALVLFPHQFLAAGSLSLILLITVVPATGGLISYIAGKRKYPPVSVA